MKKLFVLCSAIAIILATFLFIHFNKNNEYGDSIDYLKNLESYSCDVEINIKNKKQTIQYKGKQFYNKELGYRFELNKDRILLYTNNKIFVKDLANGVKYNKDKEFDKFYRLTFIGEYICLLYTNEEMKVDLRDKENSKYEVITLTIPGNNRNAVKAELFVEDEKNIPKKLIIYDSKNNESAVINYTNFIPNSNLDKKLFNPDSL
nr:germination lipoprotein GerS-related protein [Clostridium botulinum]